MTKKSQKSTASKQINLSEKSKNIKKEKKIAVPTFKDVESAARRIKGVAHNTPVMTS